MDARKVAKKTGTKITLKELAGRINFLGEEIIKIQEDRLREEMLSAPVNARADEKVDATDTEAALSSCYKTLEWEHKELQNKVKGLEEKIEERNALLLVAREKLENLKSPPQTIYRVVTNGKDYRVDSTKNDGKSWESEQELFDGCVRRVKRSSYRAAVKYIRKQYGEKAYILSREWRAV